MCRIYFRNKCISSVPIHNSFVFVIRITYASMSEKHFHRHLVVTLPCHDELLTLYHQCVYANLDLR